MSRTFPQAYYSETHVYRGTLKCSAVSCGHICCRGYGTRARKCESFVINGTYSQSIKNSHNFLSCILTCFLGLCFTCRQLSRGIVIDSSSSSSGENEDFSVDCSGSDDSLVSMSSSHSQSEEEMETEVSTVEEVPEIPQIITGPPSRVFVLTRAEEQMELNVPLSMDKTSVKPDMKDRKKYPLTQDMKN